MDVKFVSKNRGTVVIPCPEVAERHKIRFRRSYSTSSKKEIKKLLSDDFAREKTKLAPGQDLKEISDYLYSEERDDVMTKGYLKDIPFEAWEEIMETRDDIEVDFPLIGIAKASLEGKPLTSEIENIVNKYKAEADENAKTGKIEGEIEQIPKPEKKEEVKSQSEKSKSNGEVKVKIPKKKKKQEEPETEEATSEDLNATEAANYISAAPEDELDRFLSEDEDRVTVLRAWNSRFPDKAVELQD